MQEGFSIMTKLRKLLALPALAAALLPAVKAQERPTCPLGNITMSGTYVTSGTGTVAGVGPITTVGMIVYNGDGTGATVFSTTTVNGASSTSSGVSATFTVNTDCTGSKTIGTTHFNFVITPDGGTITWIVTDKGVNAMGTGVRIKR
jgi:hypothetical protein